jgi:uncharacterized protein YggE
MDSKKPLIGNTVVRAAVLVGLMMLTAACSPLVVRTAPLETPATERQIVVSGYGEAYGEPDMATLQIGYNTQDAELPSAVDRSNTTVQAIRDAILAKGVDSSDLQTSNYNVWIEQRYDPQTGQPTGEIYYHVDSTLTITVRNIADLSAILQAGLTAGANNIYGISFSVDDPTALQAEARAKAAEDAQGRAAQIAQQMGVVLGSPISISESWSGSGGMRQAEAGVAMGGGGPPISTGLLSVSVTLNVTYSFSDAE